MTKPFKIITLLAVVAGGLSGCLNLTEEYQMPLVAGSGVAINHYYTEQQFNPLNPDWQIDFREWLTQENIMQDDELLMLLPPHLRPLLRREAAQHWAVYSARELHLAKAPAGTNRHIVFRLYRQELKISSCHDGHGRYRLGCATNANRELGFYSHNPVQPSGVERSAVYEAVPGNQAITFEKPPWIVPRRGRE